MGEAQPFPTRMALTTFKQKFKAAQKGYELLKRKSDALMARFRLVTRKIRTAKEEMGDSMRTSSFSLSEAIWAAGDFKRRVVDSPKQTAAVRVKIRFENVAGVQLPVFTVVTTPQEGTESLGLAGGGKAIARARGKFTELMELLVRLASLQTTFMTLDEAIRLTNRRVNALDNVVLPRLERTVKYIDSELSEIEREEIFRIKKVLEVKVKRNAKEEEDRQNAAAEYSEREQTRARNTGGGSAAGAGAGAGTGVATGAPSLLHDADEDDVIF